MSPPLIQSDKWRWQKATIAPPLTLQAGDVVREIAGQLVVTRAGVVVATRNIGPLTEVTSSVDVNQTVSSAIFLKVNPMPGQNVSCIKVSEGATGSVTFSFSNGNNIEMSSWDDAGTKADDLDAASSVAENLLIGKAFRASPDGANKTTQVGASVSVNLLADTPVVYTEAG